MRGQLTEVQRLRGINTRLKHENAGLRLRINVLEAKVEEQNKTIETLKLQLEELRQIVFGKKKQSKDHQNKQPPDNPQSDCQPRSATSYRRPIPQEEEITEEESKPLPDLLCRDCHTPLINIRWIVRYLEDIVLPVKKLVKRLKIQTGFCPRCRKQQVNDPVSAHTVTIGHNIRQAVLYWTYITRLSFQQIIDMAWDFYGFKLSQGEIAIILQSGSNQLAIAYEQLKQRIRGSPAAHFDETTYQEQGGERYAWIMASANSEEAIFTVGRNRGKGNAEKLMGSFSGTRITDCYSAYDNLPGEHQVCWSHVIRYARELAQSKALTADKHVLCREFYGQLACLYEQVRRSLQEPFDSQRRNQAYEELTKKLLTLAQSLGRIEPKKLTDLKQRLKAYVHEFLTCLLHKHVPADNNKAERKLRHLVLKRKVSFGTRSQKGSQAFSINASVLLSWWWNERDNLFANLSRALQR
jgi:hypothetical protein